MDLPAPVEQPETDTGPEPVATGASPPVPSPTRSVSPGDVQAELAELSRRVDALAASLDTSVRAAVAEEVQRVAGELQHTVAALGRVLVRDLGRLNQILTQHRDTILAEVRGPSGPSERGTHASGRAGASASATAEADTDTPVSGPPAAGETPAADPAAAAEPADNEKGRNWRRRKA